MFSKRFYRMSTIITKLCYYFGAHLLLFDERDLLFHVVKNPASISKVRKNYILMVSWSVVSTFLVIKAYISKDFDHYNLTFFYWIGGLCFLFCSSIMIWFVEEFCRAINGLLILFRYLQKNYMPTWDPETNKVNLLLDGILLVLAVTWFGLCLIVTLICLYDPRGYIFFGVIVPDPIYSYFPTGVLVTILHGYILLLVAINVTSTLGLVITFAFYVTIFLTKELKLGQPSYRTTSKLRNSKDLILVYRSLQVLNENAMCFVGRLTVVGHTICTLIPVRCMFTLIRYWNVLQPLTKAPVLLGLPVSTGFWLFCLQLGKYLFVRGKKILGSWKRHHWDDRIQQREMKRFQKSCRLVLIRCGNQFVMARMTQFNFIKSVMRGTFRVLLATKR